MPRLQRPLIDERDRFLMSAIREAPGPRVVAIVGAGHVGGMVKYLNVEVDRRLLSEIPPPSWLRRSIKWLLVALVLVVFYRGYAEAQAQGLWPLLLAWALPNSLAVAAFSVAARAKLLTVLLAALAAPVAALIPTVGAGMVAALVEAWLRRPSDADRDGLSQVSSLADWYRNRFTRVLLVGFAAGVGATLGAFVGAVWVLVLA
jgi:pheromone shutdown protein TraB